MKIIIFGTGQLYKKYINKLNDCEVVALLDNDITKQGGMLDGYLVDSPNHISKYEYDYIIVLTKFYSEVREQLIGLGVAENKIIDKEHKGFFENVRRVQRYEIVDFNSCSKKIALITNDLTLSGAPIALFHFAKILKRMGYGVELFSFHGGPLLYEFVKERICVTVFDDFYFSELEKEYYFRDFDKIIVNSVVLLPVIIRISGGMEIIWWLHDSPIIYQGFEKVISEHQDTLAWNEISIYAVSSVAANNFYKLFPDKKVNLLPYGIPDTLSSEKCCIETKKKLVFAIIGTVHTIKGHDIFIDSIKLLTEDDKRNVEFWFVGNLGIGELKNKIEDFADSNPVVKVWGELSRQKMMDIYEKIDVIVNPSRQDALPTVVVEGMMCGKVCITSNVTGMAEFIQSQENGLICKSDSATDLAEKISWILHNQEKIEWIGENARETYKKNFSMEAFEKNVKKVINKEV